MDTYHSITFLTDFGLQDDFVGVCHGVIRRIVPNVSIVDITHGIRPQAILHGAVVLANTVPYMPVGIHLAVVDPEVGGKRRGVAVRARDGRVYVGPDNGLLMLAADAGGPETAVELTDERYRLERVSRTFHARDVFAPAAAHIAAGVALEELGPSVDESTLVRLAIPEPEVRGSQARTSVLAIDRFGNVQLNLRREQLDSFDLDQGGQIEITMQLESYYAVVASTFADAMPGELILYEDSYGLYSIAISGGDAAALTAASPGDEIRLSRP